MANKDRINQTGTGNKEALTLSPSLVPLITSWFSSTGRSLPWRESPTPYHVWLSEIMLQQTRIEAVIPYYFRFLEAFPDVESLAACDDEVLMKLWEGLGYYSRARNLKKAAQKIVTDYGGALPPDFDLLRGLPGIGDYTAGAIASIAFGLPEPAVDGNVLRVISRIAAFSDDVTTPATKSAVTSALREIYPGGEASARFTEGLMELGEVVCIPNGLPKCELCPVRELCQAHLTDTVENYPVRAPKKERRREEITVLLLRTGGKYLLHKRDSAGLLAGMWEFPNVTGARSAEEIPGAVQEILPGAEITEITALGVGKHVFTHVEWQMTGYAVELSGIPGNLPGNTIAETADVIRREYAVPTAFRKWAGMMRE